jgi:hypothetical protein
LRQGLGRGTPFDDVADFHTTCPKSARGLRSSGCSGAVTGAARRILIDEFAVERGSDLGTEGLAVPPRKEAHEKSFERDGAPSMPPHRSDVQRSARRTAADLVGESAAAEANGTPLWTA